MISLTTLLIAGGLLVGLVVLSMALPHPITWLATAIMGGILFFILVPKYQGQQQALQQGVKVEAAVQEVRHWSPSNKNQPRDKYEIVAVAPNPYNGTIQTFVSPPMLKDPQPYLGQTVTVTVDWQNPKAYVMDLSFLPFAAP